MWRAICRAARNRKPPWLLDDGREAWLAIADLKIVHGKVASRAIFDHAALRSNIPLAAAIPRRYLICRAVHNCSRLAGAPTALPNCRIKLVVQVMNWIGGDAEPVEQFGCLYRDGTALVGTQAAPCGLDEFEVVVKGKGDRRVQPGRGIKRHQRLFGQRGEFCLAARPRR